MVCTPAKESKRPEMSKMNKQSLDIKLAVQHELCSTETVATLSVFLTASTSTQQCVHDPASQNVRTWPAAVSKNFLVRATSFLKGVCKERQAVECSLGVDSLCPRYDGGGQPVGVEGDGAEGDRAEDFTHKGRAGRLLNLNTDRINQLWDIPSDCFGGSLSIGP